MVSRGKEAEKNAAAGKQRKAGSKKCVQVKERLYSQDGKKRKKKNTVRIGKCECFSAVEESAKRKMAEFAADSAERSVKIGLFAWFIGAVMQKSQKNND